MVDHVQVGQTIRTGVLQTIELPPPVPAGDPDHADLVIICAEEVRSIAKRHANRGSDSKQGYATVYNKCSQEVKDKLKALDGLGPHRQINLFMSLASKLKGCAWDSMTTSRRFTTSSKQ